MLCYSYINKRDMAFVSRQSRIPRIVGIAIDRNTVGILFVSLYIVMQVVEQGK